jgi:hypothetical protein
VWCDRKRWKSGGIKISKGYKIIKKIIIMMCKIVMVQKLMCQGFKKSTKG